MAVSVLILTLNEEINIVDCLASVAWSNDIVVLDSMSVDRTEELALNAGARVVKRKFDNWSAHQNWAVQTIDFRNPWVLYLDADERCDLSLQTEVLSRAITAAPEDAFRIRRKDFYMGRWLRRAQLYPTWLLRLFRPKRIRYERLVNPIAVVDGGVGDLQAHILHYPFSHGAAHWIARHNNYSDLEALELIKARRAKYVLGSLVTQDPNAKRRALKELFYRIPARPLLKFLYYYIARRGFLDGRPGLTYSILQAMYEFMIDTKYRELLRKEQGLPL